MEASDKLIEEIREIIKDKKNRKDEQIELKPYEWKDVKEVAREIRDGKITEAKGFIAELRKVKTLKENLSKKEFWALEDEMEKFFKEDKSVEKDKKEKEEEPKKKRKSWFFRF